MKISDCWHLKGQVHMQEHPQSTFLLVGKMRHGHMTVEKNLMGGGLIVF